MIIPLRVPASLSVYSIIFYRIYLKSFIFSRLLISNIPYGSSTSIAWTNLNSKGLLVTVPSPLGKKSYPTIDSNNELLPADYKPTIAILGNEI